MFTTIHLFIFEKINTHLKWWPMLTWNNIRQVHHKSFSQTDLNWTRSGSNSQDPDYRPPTPIHHLSLSSLFAFPHLAACLHARPCQSINMMIHYCSSSVLISYLFSEQVTTPLRVEDERGRCSWFKQASPQDRGLSVLGPVWQLSQVTSRHIRGMEGGRGG